MRTCVNIDWHSLPKENDASLKLLTDNHAKGVQISIELIFWKPQFVRYCVLQLSFGWIPLEYFLKKNK